MALTRKCIMCGNVIGTTPGKQTGITGTICTKCFTKRIRRLQQERGDKTCFRTNPNCGEKDCRYYSYCIKQ